MNLSNFEFQPRLPGAKAGAIMRCFPMGRQAAPGVNGGFHGFEGYMD